MSVRMSVGMTGVRVGSLVLGIAMGVFAPAVRAPADASEEAENGAAAWQASVDAAREVVPLEGRLAEGRQLYAVCAECHLESGLGDTAGTMPQLAGQPRNVLIKQLLDIRSGRRRNPLMYPYVARLPDVQAIADVATHIASLPPPADHGRGPGLETVRGRRLYRTHCASCHGPSGEGEPTSFTPALRGQHYRYLVRQLIDIAGARRANAHPGMVAAIEDFSARDVANVADFVSRLPVPRRPRDRVTP